MTGDIPPLLRLRDSLEEVAKREIEAADGVRRRKRPRRLVAVGAAFLCLGGAAAAADLISIGDPTPNPRGQIDRFQAAGGRQIDVTAADSPLPWGVATYETAGGQSCALAGQVRATRLGVVRGGTFRPYADDAVGSCVDLKKLPYVTGYSRLAGRAIVYGRASAAVAAVELSFDAAKREVAKPGRDGGFLFVLSDDLKPGDFALKALDRAGKVVTEPPARRCSSTACDTVPGGQGG